MRRRTNVVKFPKRYRQRQVDPDLRPFSLSGAINLRDSILNMLPRLEAEIAAAQHNLVYLRPRISPTEDGNGGTAA
jgi:hypothetical protein